MKKINNTQEFYKIVDSGELFIVYFYTKWCPDCFAIKHALPRLEEEYNNITFYQFDRDDDLPLAKHLEIYGIPSFLMFQNKEEIGRYVDKYKKSYLEVKEFIDNTLNKG